MLLLKEFINIIVFSFIKKIVSLLCFKKPTKVILFLNVKRHYKYFFLKKNLCKIQVWDLMKLSKEIIIAKILFFKYIFIKY